MKVVSLWQLEGLLRYSFPHKNKGTTKQLSLSRFFSFQGSFCYPILGSSTILYCFQLADTPNRTWSLQIPSQIMFLGWKIRVLDHKKTASLANMFISVVTYRTMRSDVIQSFLHLSRDDTISSLQRTYKIKNRGRLERSQNPYIPFANIIRPWSSSRQQRGKRVPLSELWMQILSYAFSFHLVCLIDGANSSIDSNLRLLRMDGWSLDG